MCSQAQKVPTTIVGLVSSRRTARKIARRKKTNRSAQDNSQLFCPQNLNKYLKDMKHCQQTPQSPIQDLGHGQPHLLPLLGTNQLLQHRNGCVQASRNNFSGIKG